jgi:hypothetical protein
MVNDLSKVLDVEHAWVCRPQSEGRLSLCHSLSLLPFHILLLALTIPISHISASLAVFFRSFGNIAVKFVDGEIQEIS